MLGELKKFDGEILQMNSKRAERLRNIKPSGIRRLFMVTQHLPGLISLGIGEPDFTPPGHVLEAAMGSDD